jgi:cytochrome P450
VDEILTREFIENPHPVFARLREEAPISRVGDTGVHLVATWDLIEEALARESDFSANLSGVLMQGPDGLPTVFPLPVTDAVQVIATADEPDHTVHRALAQPRFTTQQIAAMEKPIRAWTKEAIEPWIGAGGGDFVPISEVIPARVVAALLGLPDGDVSRHRQWAMMGGDMLAGRVTHGTMAALATESAKASEYLTAHLEAARRGLRTDPDAPLLHPLARGVDDGTISTEQAVGIAMVMFGAGGESTAALIGNVMRRLAEAPDVTALLRSDPSRIPRFVEEVARLDAPFNFHYRAVKTPCQLGGAELVSGDRLMLLWASANRDAAYFEEPDELRLDRKHPKNHLSFGRGAHFCIGGTLARLEARIVCEELLAGTRELSLSVEAPAVRAQSLLVHRYERLFVVARPCVSASRGDGPGARRRAGRAARSPREGD